MDGMVLGDGKKAASDPALVGNENQPVTGRVQGVESVDYAGQDPDVVGVRTVMYFFHQSAVSVEEDRGMSGIKWHHKAEEVLFWRVVWRPAV
jgi:hypothetical protein